MRQVAANITGGAIYQLGCTAEQPTPWRTCVPSVVEWEAQLPCSQHGVSQMYVSLGGLPSMSRSSSSRRRRRRRAMLLSEGNEKKERQNVSNKKMDWP